MNPDQILASFSPPHPILSVTGALQLGSRSWGVFDDEPFEIVARNPHGWPCKVSINRNGDGSAAAELDYFERRSFAVPQELEKDSQTFFSALFTVDGPPEVDPIVEEVVIYSLGGKRCDVLSDEGIEKAGKLAARELWREYLSAVGHEDPLGDFAWHVEHGSTVEHAAATYETTLEEAGEWMATYKGAREKYLLGMMLEAKARVEAQLAILRAMASE